MSTGISKKILILVPNGIVYRNLFQTDVLAGIMNDSALDVVFAVNTQLRSDIPGALPMQNLGGSGIFPRLIISMLRKRFQKISPTSSTNILLSEPLYPGFKFSFAKIGCYPFPRSKWLFLALESLCRTWIIRRNIEARKLFEELQIDLVLSCHPTSTEEIDYTAEARKRGITIIGLVKSFDNLTTAGYMPVMPDVVAVWNSKMRYEALDIYSLQARNVRIIGAPQLDYRHQESEELVRQFRASLGLGSGGKLLLYATVAAVLNPWDCLIVQYIKTRCLKEADRLIVRLHQNDSMARWTHFEGDTNVIIFNPSEEKVSNLRVQENTFLDKLKLQVAASDLVINTASTMTFDAFEQKTPVVNVAFDLDSRKKYKVARFYEFTHYKHLMSSRNLRVAGSIEELGQILDSENTYIWEEEEEYRREILGPADTPTLLAELIRENIRCV